MDDIDDILDQLEKDEEKRPASPILERQKLENDDVVQVRAISPQHFSEKNTSENGNNFLQKTDFLEEPTGESSSKTTNEISHEKNGFGAEIFSDFEEKTESSSGDVQVSTISHSTNFFPSTKNLIPSTQISIPSSEFSLPSDSSLPSDVWPLEADGVLREGDPKSTEPLGLTPQNGFVGVTPQNDFVGLTPQNDFVGLTPQNGFVGVTPQNNFVGLTPQNGFVGVTPQNDFVGVAHQDDLGLLTEPASVVSVPSAVESDQPVSDPSAPTLFGVSTQELTSEGAVAEVQLSSEPEVTTSFPLPSPPPSPSPLPEFLRPSSDSAPSETVTPSENHSLNSAHTTPISIPTGKAVGFQPASWNAIDDVSDSELEQFLSALGETEGTSLSAELQLVPADNPLTGYTGGEVIDSNQVTDSSHVLWSEEGEGEEPPLEMAPPIPMTLLDVTEFMEQELLGPLSESDETLSESVGLVSDSGILSPDRQSSTFEDVGGDSERTSNSDEPLIQLSIEGSQDTNPPGPSDYLIAGGEGAGPEDSTGEVEGTFRSVAPSFIGDENATVAPPGVIFSADNLGKVKPEWVPDHFAPICMLCGGRFSLVKRRHHCRACGSVICASCGNYKAKLEYLEMREDRVCALCNETFQFRNGEKTEEEKNNNNNDDEAFRSHSPVVVSAFNGSLPPSVLRRREDERSERRERRNVVFFDGIRPGGDLTESFHENGRRLALMNAKRQRRSPGAPPEAPPPPKSRTVPKKSSGNHVVRLFVNRDVLPVMEMTKDGHYVLHETPDLPRLLKKFSVCPSESVDFYVNLCLRVSVQLLELKCCMNEIVWFFATSGMRLVGQDEVVILLVKQEEDALPPRDVFLHLNEIFLHAKQGHVINNLGHSIVALGGYDCGFLGNRNNSGFLFFRQTFQCLNFLKLPEAPFLFGVLMTKWEVPWAKMFPLRLMLRLGTEYRYYPCPLISNRNRKAVFEEVGHTVMNLLCDFRNFQYHLPCVEDTECCMEKGIITVRFPRYRYDQIVKVCQGSNEHVLAIGLGFSKRADAHLVCVQNFENGQYETQAINIESKGRKVTGTSFIIFNASLKGSEALECRAAVVEDGIMAQINIRGLEELKNALKSMRNIAFKAVRKTDDVTAPAEQETILIEWTNDSKTCNSGVRSPIDGKDMTGIESRRVSLKHSMDFLNGTLSIRCTEVFLTDEKEATTKGGVGGGGGGGGGMTYREEIDVSRLAENLAMASCSVLRPHLFDFRDTDTTKVALRVSLGPDVVEYEVGAKGERFPPQMLTEFDDKIMPLIYECARVWGVRPRLEMELIFRVFQH